jgi:hypothetical protein
MALTRNVNGVDVELTPEEEAEWHSQQELDTAEWERVMAEQRAREEKAVKLQEALELFAKEKGIL